MDLGLNVIYEINGNWHSRNLLISPRSRAKPIGIYRSATADFRDGEKKIRFARIFPFRRVLPVTCVMSHAAKTKLPVIVLRPSIIARAFSLKCLSSTEFLCATKPLVSAATINYTYRDRGTIRTE